MRIAILICALACAGCIAARAEIQQDVVNRDPAGGGGVTDGDLIDFGDADGNFDADKIGPAIEELDDPNESGPNAPDGKVNWEQLIDVPEGFADGTDDGGGGGSLTVEESDGTPTVSDADIIQFGPEFTVTDETGGQAQVDVNAVASAKIGFDDSGDGFPAGVTTVEDALDCIGTGPVGGPNDPDGCVDFLALKNVPIFRHSLARWNPQGFVPPASDFATIWQVGGLPVVRFHESTNQCTWLPFAMPTWYSGNGAILRLTYAMETATSGDVDWNAAFGAIGDGEMDLDSIAFATAEAVIDTTVPANANLTDVVEISFTDGAEMDGCGAGEACLIQLCRGASDDTASGYGYIVNAHLMETP